MYVKFDTLDFDLFSRLYILILSFYDFNPLIQNQMKGRILSHDNFDLMMMSFLRCFFHQIIIIFCMWEKNWKLFLGTKICCFIFQETFIK